MPTRWTGLSSRPEYSHPQTNNFRRKRERGNATISGSFTLAVMNFLPFHKLLPGFGCLTTFTHTPSERERDTCGARAKNVTITAKSKFAIRRVCVLTKFHLVTKLQKLNQNILSELWIVVLMAKLLLTNRLVFRHVARCLTIYLSVRLSPPPLSSPFGDVLLSGGVASRFELEISRSHTHTHSELFHLTFVRCVWEWDGGC